MYGAGAAIAYIGPGEEGNNMVTLNSLGFYTDGQTFAPSAILRPALAVATFKALY